MDTDAATTGRTIPSEIIPVGDLVRRVASALERNFGLAWTSGEVSNLTRAGSGHWYFSLKDREAQVRCVMFRNRNQYVDWMPRDGDQIEARVVPGLYVPRGEFQFQVEQMRRAGAGAWFEAFLRIKARLDAAGLFDVARKRPLPRHPRTIGVVTSLQAAALRDVLTTLARRAPHVRVIVYPTVVQGPDAPMRIVEAMATATDPSSRYPIDVLLLVRGGGSIEDLWAFNDEGVAHAIAGAAVPVVTGIGHETDFTIADFVADVRAPTPTGAAELASPDAAALIKRLALHRNDLGRGLERRFNALGQRLDEGTRRLRSPDQRLVAARSRLDEAVRRMRRSQEATFDHQRRSVDHALARLRLAGPALDRTNGRLAGTGVRLRRAVVRRLEGATHVLASAQQRLVLLDPKGILARGYAIATDRSGNIIRDAASVGTGQQVIVEVAVGRFATRVSADDDA